MEAPLVSVIIPTFNRPRFLKEAIASVLNQTYQNFEILAVNDGGKDVRRLLKDPRIHYFVHEHNQGPSAARNTALKSAEGSYICYLDDDDFFYPAHIQTLVTALQTSSFAVAHTNVYDALKEEVRGKIYTYTRNFHSTQIDPLEILIDNHMPPVALMHKKECLHIVGLFDELLRRHEDWDFLIRLSRHFPFLHIPLVTAEYATIEGSSQAHTQWMGHFLNSMQHIHFRYRDHASPEVVKAQEKKRELLRCWSMRKLETLPEFIPVIREIAEGSLRLSSKDVLQTEVLCDYLLKQSPENSELREIMKMLQAVRL